MRMFQSKRSSFFIHKLSKAFYAAGYLYCNCRSSVVCAFKKQSVEKRLHRHLFSRIQIHGGAYNTYRIRGYCNRIIKLTIFKCHKRSHNLCRNRHGMAKISIFFVKQLPGFNAHKSSTFSGHRNFRKSFFGLLRQTWYNRLFSSGFR